MLVPTFVINFPGYPKDWERFAADGRQLFTDPDLLAYYPASAIESVFNRYVRIDQGALRERRMKGYQNALRFHKMFMDAEAVKAVGKFDMVVRNPDPIDPAVQKGMWGNGTSNVAHLIVNYRY